MTVKEIKTSSDYDKNRPKMNDSAHYLDRQIERFYDAVLKSVKTHAIQEKRQLTL